MATALQQQLAAIAANSTHQLDLKAQKARHSKSLLFEARDAAAQNFDTIYQLCLEGFEELCRLDARFVPFSRNLFSEQSKSEDRTNMTAKENAQLDGVIERFLGLLGGRLLLKPAMKAAEWLVRRFRVHEYNTDAILFTFLPYHSSHIFTTLLSILPDQLPPIFRFLHPYVTQEVQNPPRHAIVVAASNTSAFITAFSQYVHNVAKAKHQSTLLLGFWASVTAQAVSGMIDATRSGRETIRRQKEEDLLLKVLPILESSLSIKGVPELYLASCMIMTIMATKASLSEKVLNAMMDAVVGAWTEQTIDDGLVCIAVLAEEKQHLSLSRITSRKLIERDELLASVERIGSKYRVEKLLMGVGISAIDSLSQEPHPRAAALLSGLLSSNSLPEPCKLLVLEAALKHCVDRPSTEQSGDRRQAIMSALSQRVNQEDLSRLLKEASRMTSIDLAKIDADLALQIRQGEVESEEESEELVLAVDATYGYANHSRMSLDDIPALPGKDTSFLDPTHQYLFDAYSEAFTKASRSKHDLTALLGTPALHRSNAAKRPGLLSFLARLWTSGAAVSTKVKVLQTTCDILEDLRQGDQISDLQALIPYLIAALADPAKAVRSAAAEVCLRLNRLYEATNKHKGPESVTIWAQKFLYGKKSTKVHWLSSTDAHKILSEALIPILEDCIIDQNYISQALADSINAPSATAKANRKELKQALRASFFSSLASHVVCSPVLQAQIKILHVLKKIGKVAGTSRTQILLPYIEDHFAKSSRTIAATGADQLCQALVANVTARSSDEVQFLKTLAVGKITTSPENHSLAFSRLRQIWNSMKDAAQQDLVDWLVGLSLDTDSSEETQSNAVEALKSLSLPTHILVHLVETLPSVTDHQEQPPSAKKRRTSDVAEPGGVDKRKLGNAVSKITLVLEVVEGSKPERHPQLLKGLFYLLSELQHYRTLLESELVYLQGLLVNDLLSVVNGLRSAPVQDVDKSVIRADLIVECVRTTSSTQVHQSALLLMSSLASWIPDLVLHSVMPLFTFMSATILKQGDDYSAHVTDQTVSRIIPPLAASLKKRGKNLVSGAAELLLSFTAAFEHIPLHRRTGLFQHLVETLGANEALSAIVAMLTERYAEDPSVLPFLAALMAKFSCSTQLVAVRQYLDLVFDTLRVKRGLSDVILGYGEKSAEQATVSTAVLLEGLASTLSSATMRKQLAKDLKKGGADPELLRNTYSSMLEKAMQLELQLKANDDLHDSATNVLAALLGLMPTSDFIEASGTLMQAGSDDIRQRVFWSLEQRVKSAKHGDRALQKVFIELLPQCALFVNHDQTARTRLSAIKCIDCIADRFGKTDRGAVFDAAQQIAGKYALGAEDEDGSLKEISILCLASMVEVLGDEFIPILPQTLDTIIRYMDEEQDSELLDAGFSFGLSILDHIPWMLCGQHLNRLLLLSAVSGLSRGLDFSAAAAKKVSAEIFLSAMKESWDSVVKLSVQTTESAAQHHVQALRQAVHYHTKATISKNSQLLFDILLQAHDLRRVFFEADEEDDATVLSELVNSTTMETVLKLNDAIFRPFFIRLGEWSNSPKSDQDKTLRQMSFFSFALIFFEQLKSLVTSYASYLIEDAASLLNSLSSTSRTERGLLELVLDTLASNFSGDQDGFWQSPAHFNAIAKPLVSRLQFSGTMDATKKIIPAIVELTVAAQSQDLHKIINGMIMGFMRHESPEIRLAAVKCQRKITDRLHIDWLHLLPEMLPFISELQEDDEGQVERETLRWIHQIEEVTGESLDSMLQ